MKVQLTDEEPLPAVLQIALHYVMPGERAIFTNVFAFDALFARIVAGSREPLFAQLRLAWWREELSRSDAPSTGPTPLLNQARMHWGSPATPVTALLDGWENLLEEPIRDDTAAAFCNGRAAIFCALALRADATDATETAKAAAIRWSLAELVVRAKDERVRRRLLDQGRDLPPLNKKLPRALRPLAVLDTLAQRSLERGGKPLLDGRLSLALAMRVGQFGS